jgi:hypothetical protein
MKWNGVGERTAGEYRVDSARGVLESMNPVEPAPSHAEELVKVVITFCRV